MSKAASDFTADTYNMDHKRRGVALIFSNKDFHRKTKLNTRKGTDVDAAGLLKVFTKMGFTTTVERDLTADQMKAKLQGGR